MLGITKVIGNYRLGRTIPDFLIIMTDSTYFNMKLFPELLQNVYRVEKSRTATFNESDELIISGCSRKLQFPNKEVFVVPQVS